MGNILGVEIDAVAPSYSDDKENLWDGFVGSGPWYTCKADGEIKPRVAKKGPSGEQENPSLTLQQMLTRACERRGEKQALKVERPCPPLSADNKAPPALPEEDWTAWTYNEWNQEARDCGKACMAMGMEVFGTVNAWGFNAPEWHIGCYAAGYAGGKFGGLYPTDTPDTAAYKVVHSGGSVLIVEDKSKVDKLVKALNERGDAKKLKVFVAYGFDPAEGEKVSVKGCGDIPVMGWKAFLAMGAQKVSDEELSKRAALVKPGHCSVLVYTSGTTGQPKAVMLSHDTICAEAKSVMASLGASSGFGEVEEQERVLSYLPLSHVAGKMLDMVAPVTMTATCPGWGTVYYARNYDLKAGTIKDRLCVARPTIFLGVPLVWEKIADKLRAIGAETTGIKKDIATWAKGLGLQHAKDCLLGGAGRYPVGYGLANTLVLTNVKAALGLDQCKVAITGAAPIRVDTLEYFASLGLSILEVYGMSETCGASTVSTFQAHAWGSVGFELPGIEVKVFKVDVGGGGKKIECAKAPGLESTDEEFQGEICMRGRTVMMGYLANPDLGPEHVAEIEQKTAEAVDSEGWMHSGDKGMITVAGLTKITGRYKEIIIGEGGENIAPVPIEDHVKGQCDGIMEVMMVGDKRKYNVAIITLKAVGANGEVPGTDALEAGAKRLNPEVSTISAALDDKMWIDTVTAAITSANNNGKICSNNSFKIQKFTILPNNFSEEMGELTPTKKLKRKEVERIYAVMIEKMYASKDTYVRYSA